MKGDSIETRCVHEGTYYDTSYKGICSPIYTSSSFSYLEGKENLYPRYFNVPNQSIVEKKIASLENGEDCIVFSSGMAAISSTLLTLLKPGDHALFQRDIYGGTFYMLNSLLKKMNIDFDFFDSHSIDNLDKSIKADTRLIYIESPSNPLLSIVDIRYIASLSRSKNIVSIIDNTFSTPINQLPIDEGLDIVIHSGTKYLSGHSDMTCGAVISTKKVVDNIRHMAVNLGGQLNAFSCYLLERSLKTLSLRVVKQCDNAMSIATFLANHPKVLRVYYPGLADHSNHLLAKKQMQKFGAIVSFESIGDSLKVLSKFKIISHCLSLGGVETMACIPSKTSHVLLSKEERHQIGISDNLIRLSVGIEGCTDLIKDLQQSLI